MTNRHIGMEYPAKQIQLEPLPLIYCRGILLFSFFFPSELEINNSAGNHSVLVANSLTSHPISFSLSLSFSLLCSRRLIFSTLLLSAPFVSTGVCLLCVYVRLLKSLCMLVWVVIHLFLAHSAPLPSSFPSFLSFILPSPLLSSPLRS